MLRLLNTAHNGGAKAGTKKIETGEMSLGRGRIIVGMERVRNIWNNLSVYNLNLWMHTLVELWSWQRMGTQLVDRTDSPWDDPHRRPACQSSQRPTASDHERTFIDDHHSMVARTRNHQTHPEPDRLGRVTTRDSQKVQPPNNIIEELLLCLRTTENDM